MNDAGPMSEVKISFVNVGFGDCTVALDKSNNQALLVDCPPWGADAALEALEGCRLDTVIVSHLDLDHYGGVVDVVKGKGGCREFKMAPVVSLNNKGKIKIRAFAREIATFLRSGAGGWALRAGDEGYLGKVRWVCLSPWLLQDLEALGTTNNRASVVLRLDLEATRILIGSDADGVVWKDLIDRIPDELRAEVFRYPHHGAPLTVATGKAALSEVLDVVRPSDVVLSIGERSRYSHPRLEVISGLRAANCRVVCTRSTSLCNDGQRSDLACAGTVALEWSPEGWAITPSVRKHTEVVDALPTPACRDVDAQR